MAEQTPPSSASPRIASRGTQYALVFLCGVAVALIGHRLVSDRYGARPTELHRPDATAASPANKQTGTSQANKPLPSRRIDLNRAERHELMQLPGVGPSMADGILAYREAKGGFQRIEDLRGVRGIGATTLEKLKPWVIVDAPDSDEPVVLARRTPAASGGKRTLDGPIDLNAATAAELEQLPGIGPTLAQRIIDERAKKPFAKIDDLRRVSGIGPKRLEQVKPLVRVEQ